MGFLYDAAEYLFFPPAGRCPCCGKENGNGEVCEACARELAQLLRETVPGASISKYAHSGAARRMVLRLKFEGRKKLAVHMARELAPLVPPGMDVVTFVPLHPARRRKRGYDQAELIANALASFLNIPCEQLLIRVKNTPAQSARQSAPARALNMKDAFRPAEGADIAGRSILLVDDVITTGSTIGECRKQLFSRRAARVTAISFTAPGRS